jgi:methionyl-tRNA formyltransferase
MVFFFKRVLIFSDNPSLCIAFLGISRELNIPDSMYEVAHSPRNQLFSNIKLSGITPLEINIRKDIQSLINRYDLILSIHCKQIFPKELVQAIKCINLHPGMNPFNRGWYPQVFSIINNLPLGATLHEMDEELDHGPIIAQEDVPVFSWDTSLSAYKRVLEAEKNLIRKNLITILCNNYSVFVPDANGTLNLKSDFNNLCEINLDEKLTMGEAINKLRALSHGEFKNAHFIDLKQNKKVYIKMLLLPEDLKQ